MAINLSSCCVKRRTLPKKLIINLEDRHKQTDPELRETPNTITPSTPAGLGEAPLGGRLAAGARLAVAPRAPEAQRGAHARVRKRPPLGRAA
jgi:hypothetical protein